MLKNILIIIPARGGSKGIPRKNLRMLGGKPLIYYSIANALSISGYSCDCYVSTDDEEIAMLSAKFGSKIINRDGSLAKDMVTLDPVIHDAYTKVSGLEDKVYDLVITMQPTSPLLKKETLEKAIAYMLEKDVDTLISGVWDSHLTWLKKDGEYQKNYEKRVNRQLLPEIYKETGGFVITRARFVKENSRFGEKVEIFPLSKMEAIDIDDFEDWNLCEYYLKRKTILFVVAGNQEIGMGHAYNTLSIANDILDHRIVFLTIKGSDLAYNKILESNYEVYRQEADSLLDEIDRISPDLVINDILDTSEAYVGSLKDRGYKVANFEDLGPGSGLADLVINAMYPEKQVILNHYYGSKYFILRDEFMFTDVITVNPEVKHVLLTFGGVDPNNFTMRVLKVLEGPCRQKGISISVITGLGYRQLTELREKFPDVTIKSNIRSMSDELRVADLVFTSAGRTTFEAASLGIPAIVLCQNERETTHFFASWQNGFLNLGLGTGVSDEEILQAFESLVSFDSRVKAHKKMEDSQLKKGKQRVIKLIKEIL